MSSIRFVGVSFVAYSMDHAPRHVHGVYAEVDDLSLIESDPEEQPYPYNALRNQ